MADIKTIIAEIKNKLANRYSRSLGLLGGDDKDKRKADFGKLISEAKPLLEDNDNEKSDLDELGYLIKEMEVRLWIDGKNLHGHTQRENIVREILNAYSDKRDEPIQPIVKEVNYEPLKNFLVDNNLITPSVDSATNERTYNFKELSDAITEWKELKTKNAELQTLLDTTKLEKNDLTGQLNTQNETLSSKEQEIKKLKEETVAGLTKEKNDLVIERDELKKKVQTLTQTNIDEKTASQEQLKILGDELAATKTELENIKSNEKLGEGSDDAKLAKIEELQAEQLKLTKEKTDWENWYEGLFGREKDYDRDHTKSFYQDLVKSGEKLNFLTENKKGVNWDKVSKIEKYPSRFANIESSLRTVLELKDADAIPLHPFLRIVNKDKLDTVNTKVNELIAVGRKLGFIGEDSNVIREDAVTRIKKNTDKVDNYEKKIVEILGLSSSYLDRDGYGLPIDALDNLMSKAKHNEEVNKLQAQLTKAEKRGSSSSSSEVKTLQDKVESLETENAALKTLPESINNLITILQSEKGDESDEFEESLFDIIELKDNQVSLKTDAFNELKDQITEYNNLVGVIRNANSKENIIDDEGKVIIPNLVRAFEVKDLIERELKIDKIEDLNDGTDKESWRVKIANLLKKDTPTEEKKESGSGASSDELKTLTDKITEQETQITTYKTALKELNILDEDDEKEINDGTVGEYKILAKNILALINKEKGLPKLFDEYGNLIETELSKIRNLIKNNEEDEMGANERIKVYQAALENLGILTDDKKVREGAVDYLNILIDNQEVLEEDLTNLFDNKGNVIKTEITKIKNLQERLTQSTPIVQAYLKLTDDLKLGDEEVLVNTDKFNALIANKTTGEIFADSFKGTGLFGENNMPKADELVILKTVYQNQDKIDKLITQQQKLESPSGLPDLFDLDGNLVDDELTKQRELITQIAEKDDLNKQALAKIKEQNIYKANLEKFKTANGDFFTDGDLTKLDEEELSYTGKAINFLYKLIGGNEVVKDLDTVRIMKLGNTLSELKEEVDKKLGGDIYAEDSNWKDRLTNLNEITAEELLELETIKDTYLELIGDGENGLGLEVITMRGDREVGKGEVNATALKNLKINRHNGKRFTNKLALGIVERDENDLVNEESLQSLVDFTVNRKIYEDAKKEIDHHLGIDIFKDENNKPSDKENYWVERLDRAIKGDNEEHKKAVEEKDKKITDLETKIKTHEDLEKSLKDKLGMEDLNEITKDDDLNIYRFWIEEVDKITEQLPEIFDKVEDGKIDNVNEEQLAKTKTTLEHFKTINAELELTKEEDNSLDTEKLANYKKGAGADLEEVIAKKDERIEGLINVISDAKDKIKELEANQITPEELEQAQTDFAEKVAERDSLNETITNKDKRIKELEGLGKNAFEKIKALNAKLTNVTKYLQGDRPATIDLDNLPVAPTFPPRADGVAIKPSINDLHGWFKNSVDIYRAGDKQLEVFTKNADNKWEVDVDKVKGYRDSKTTTDFLKNQSIPNLFNADGTLNEATATALKADITLYHTLIANPMNADIISGGKLDQDMINALRGTGATVPKATFDAKQKEIDDAKTYLNNLTDLSNASLKPYKDAYNNSPIIGGQLTAAQNTITNTGNYLKLNGKRLENVIDNTHADYIDLDGNSLTDLVYWNKENDKLLDTRANGLDIFDRNPANGLVVALNLNKIENHAKSLTRLGLADFDQATIAGKLGTNKLSDIPLGKTLTDVLADSAWRTGHACSAPCGLAHCPDVSHHTNYATLQTESQEYQRIHSKLSGNVSDADLTSLLNAVPNCSHGDYDAIKTALAEEKEKATKQHEACELEKAQVQAQKEQEIVNKIITDLELATEKDKEDMLEAVITEIKSKINPPTFTPTQLSTELDKLTDAEKQSIISETKPSSEIVEQMITFAKGLGINENELVEARSYKQLIEAQNKLTKTKLSELSNEKKVAMRFNIGLGALTIGTLIALAWVLVKGVDSENKITQKDE